MFKTFINAWKVKDIRTKMLYTLLLIVVYRLGSFIPIPGVNAQALAANIANYDLLGFLNLFSGGSLSQFSLFAMGISPYITGSIIVQLLTIAIPALEKLSKEEDGRQKIERITRYVGVGLAAVQSLTIIVTLQNMSSNSILNTLNLFKSQSANLVITYITIAICCTAGTAFLMWMGERITEKGVGNGISMLIFASIISSVPDVFVRIFRYWEILPWHTTYISNNQVGVLRWWAPLVALAVTLILVVGICAVDRAYRRIPVQYAKRVVGRKLYGGQSTHIPMKANANGVMPLIFAMTLLQVPAMIAQFWSNQNAGFPKFVSTYLSSSTRNPAGIVIYNVLYGILIIGFAYFYSTISFNPVDISKNLQQNGGFIPGIRPGKPTSDYLQKKSSRLTMFGALYLCLIAIIPSIILNLLGVDLLSHFGATSILIMVSVALETAEQLDSLLLMRHYKGFLG
ncbi:MAG: preprotein translocase subunit SecY [Clostridia bacterium]|nr:preprotein translocase subunit SecY [Clostridia bacterium]MBQ4447850.1 preprotein translocase subunit SecY [Clostridia bacterium]